MIEENLKAFLTMVEADASLRDQLNASAEFSDIAALAQKAGLVLSPEDISRWLAEDDDQELSRADLEYVAGGKRGDLCKQFPLATKHMNCTNW